MNWEDIREDKQELLKKLNKFGAEGIADICNKTTAGVTYFAKKHNLIYNRSEGVWREAEKEAEVEKEEEKHKNKNEKTIIRDDQQFKIIEYEEKEYYLIENKNTGKIVKPSYNEVEKIYFYYCEDGYELTQVETADLIGIAYDKFETIKEAMDIVHDSVAQPIHKLRNNEEDDLIDERIEEKRRKYKDKARVKEQRAKERELKKYRQDNYLAEKKINKIIPEVKEIEYQPSKFAIQSENKSCDYLVPTVDLHVGKKVEGENLLGKPKDYNKSIMWQRAEKYISRVIEGIKADKPEKIYIPEMGDTADGKDIYEGQSKKQELYGGDQIVAAAEILEYMIKSIHDYQPNIELIKGMGNHGRNDDSDYLIGKMVEKSFDNYDEIKFDTNRKEYKYRTIRGFNHVFTHGQHIRSGTNTRPKDVLSIIQQLGLQDKHTYVYQGHLHHLAKEGAKHNHWLLPSMIGGDWLSNNAMNEGARPSQIFMRVTDEGLDGLNPVYFD